MVGPWTNRMPRPDSAESTGAEALLTVWAFGGLSDPSLGTSSGRAARGSVFPRKATCHPASAIHMAQGRRRAYPAPPPIAKCGPALLL